MPPPFPWSISTWGLGPQWGTALVTPGSAGRPIWDFPLMWIPGFRFWSQAGGSCIFFSHSRSFMAVRINRRMREEVDSQQELYTAGTSSLWGWPRKSGFGNVFAVLLLVWCFGRLENCHLTEACCKELSSALIVSQSLTHLCLAKNALGNGGVKLLCEGLSYPDCQLQTLV